MTDRPPFDLLVVGAGPAGIAAAVSAAESGRRVGLVDDNPRPGGQIWRGKPPREAAGWFDRIRASTLEVLSGIQALGPVGPGTLLAESGGEAVELRYRRLILATGARELFLPFPGWTLPNVFGAGGLQVMVKSGLPIAGKRVVVAGTGPLLPAVAAEMKRRGADVRLVAEQAPFGRVARFGLGLWRDPGKLRQAVGIGWTARNIALRYGCWPVSAEGDGRVEVVTVTDGNRARRVDCDVLACGFGLVPNVELAIAMGCAVGTGGVAADASGRTSVPDVFVAGEVSGIGGVDLAIVEGQIAGYAAADEPIRARELFDRRERGRRFARRLGRAFALRDELRRLARPETIVCRCEDVIHGALVGQPTWLDAKLQTRCGMGACQGRVCGAAGSWLYGWGRASVRPPIFPTDLGHLGSRRETPESAACRPGGSSA